MSIQTIYPALIPLWNELQNTIARVHTQDRDLAHPPRICFVGRFKTGKSRLINALVGGDVLPYNTDECTAQLVELVWAGKDRASRLSSLDLDSASEHLISLDQFRNEIDLTAISSGAERIGEAVAFRRGHTSHLLLTSRLIDTPGFDGPNSEARTWAEEVRRQAIKQSDLCVLVLGAGFGEDDEKCAHLIKDFGLEMIVVLNQSDKYDGNERQEIREQILTDLSEKVGLRPLIYTCSALWQGGTHEDREFVQQQRQYFDLEEEADWHQWDALVRRLSQPDEGIKQVALLTATHRAFAVARQIHEEYDITLQAEAIFLHELPRWRKMMPSLVGQTVLEMAVTAAESGKSLPWKRLYNFGVTPEKVAPESILPLDEMNALVTLYTKTLAEVAQFARDQQSVALYRFLLLDFFTFALWLEENWKLSPSLSTALKTHREAVDWYSLPLQEKFTYQNALSGLKKRWAARPESRDEDCARIRRRLAAALA